MVPRPAAIRITWDLVRYVNSQTRSQTYRIKNSSTDNIYGGGKEKIIIEEGSSAGDGLAELLIEIVPWWVWIIIVVVILIIQKTCF